MTDGGDEPVSPTDREVVDVAAQAAEDLVLSRVGREAIEDLDITIRFEDGVLEVDVYLHAPSVDAEQITEDATLAAESAVDDLFEDS